MNKDFKTVLFSINNNVATITLNRPKVHNAFDAIMIEEIIELFNYCSESNDVRVVVLQGTGKSFSAGADLNWMREIISYSYEENLKESNRISDLMEAINYCKKATISRVHGATIGGGTGLAVCCDIVLASEKAVFSLSEVKIGLVPACISPYVINRVGPAKARECFITGERIPAEKAVKMGLASEVVKEEDLDKRLSEIISTLLKNGPEAIKWSKILVDKVPGMPIEEVKGYTAGVIATLRVSPEGQEGMDAFLNKRKAKWCDNDKKSINS